MAPGSWALPERIELASLFSLIISYEEKKRLKLCTKEGKSRGHAIIEYDHPVEAVQAISMFNNQSVSRKLQNRDI